MGVHGLWKLIDPSGKVVPLETLENKVLAIDLSIWLHQALKGFRDSKGAPLPNAHLLAIYHRVCKLLYFRIKPVFVFDGGVPILKKETIAKRNQLKNKNVGEVNRLQKKLLNTLLKHSAINKVLSERTKNNLGTTTSKISSQTKDDDLFKLPEVPQLDSTVSSSSDDEDISSQSYTGDSSQDSFSPTKNWDIYTLDEKSKEFKSLPADVRYEILTDLKETRKQSSWGRIHEMPTQSDDFSNYQMKRLLKRQAIQASLEAAEKEMGGHSLSLRELETLLTDQGVITSQDVGSRIAKDTDTRYLYIKDVKKAIEEARLQEEKKSLSKINEESQSEEEEDNIKLSDLKRRIKNRASTVKGTSENLGESSKNIVSSVVVSEAVKDIGEEKQVSRDEIKKEKINDADYDEDLAYAIQLSLQEDGAILKEDVKKPDEEVDAKVQEEKDLDLAIQLSLRDKLHERYASSSNFYSEQDNQQNKFEDKNEFSWKKKAASEANRNLFPLINEDGAKQMAKDLSEAFTASTSKVSLKKLTTDSKDFEFKKPHNFSFLGDDFTADDFGVDDSEPELEDRETASTVMSSAKSYMLEYSGLTPAEVSKIIGKNNLKAPELKNTGKLSKLSKIINTKSADAVFESEKNMPQKNFVVHSNILTSRKEGAAGDNNRLKETKQDDELISDNSSDSDDFLEVPVTNKTVDENEKFFFEVVVEPKTELEDDLFADIFEEPKQPEIKLSPKLKDKIERNLPENKNFKAIKQIILGKLDAQIPGKSPEKQTDEQTNSVKETNSTSKAVTQTQEKPQDALLQLKDELNKQDEEGKNHDVNKDLDFLEKIKEDNISVSKEILEDDYVEKEVPKHDSLRELLKTVAPEKEDGTYSQLSDKQLQALQANLMEESRELIKEKATNERLATNLSDQMYQEAQELLELFGVPYIVAPMEAEAQCAFLEQINLTDGTITDDSDIWLFGGRTVYKNFFNQSKHVLEFRSESIQHHFKLNRYQLVLLALLVGSDYTTGIQGVGPVTALEVLASFPPNAKSTEILTQYENLINGLREFKSWYCRGKSTGKQTLRAKLKNVVFSENFPSIQVVQAYMEPQVDISEDKFSWAKPDIVGLKDFAREKFGWTQVKSEEILKPIIKRLEDSQCQKSIRDYFTTKYKEISGEAKSKMSKRVKKAVKKMEKGESESSDENESKKEKKASKPRRRKSTQNEDLPKKKKKPLLDVPTEVEMDLDFVEVAKTLEAEMEKNLDSHELLKEASENTLNEKPKTKTRKTKPTKAIAAISKDASGDVASEAGTDSYNAPSTSKLADPTSQKKKASRSKEKAPPNLKSKKAATAIMATGDPELDAALVVLKQTTARSKIMVNQIQKEVKKEFNTSIGKKENKDPPEVVVKKVMKNLHRKEYIHQKERDKSQIMRSKMKAIEVFRRSKQGPGYVKKRGKVVRAPKENAELSESSDDESN